jgi:hypothetical protein
MRRTVLALLLTVFCAAPFAAERGATAAIDHCLAQLDTLDRGYERIAARCPDLTPSLMESPLAAWLPRDWNEPGNQLSADGLVEVRALLVREAARVPASHQPRTSTVAGVLAALAAPGARDQPRGWWARFKSWLHELFTPRPQPHEDGWLQRLVARMQVPAALERWILGGVLALIVALALAIVVNELRIAGVLGARRRSGELSPGGSAGARDAVTLEELERASPSQQPRLLLELVAVQLVAQSRLPPARALTVRELSGMARIEDAADRARLNELAATCERVRFSGEEVAPALLARALMRGRELLASLQATGVAPQAA